MLRIAKGQAPKTADKKFCYNSTTTWSKNGAHSFSRVVQPQNKHIDLCLGEEIPDQAGNERELDSTTTASKSAAERKHVNNRRRNYVCFLSHQSLVKHPTGHAVSSLPVLLTIEDAVAGNRCCASCVPTRSYWCYGPGSACYSTTLLPRPRLAMANATCGTPRKHIVRVKKQKSLENQR